MSRNNRASSKIAIIAQIAIMTAVMCVLGPLAIPIGPVPISLTTFMVALTVYIFGMKKGMVSYVIYLLLGLVGVPVFTYFTGGVGKVLGPTGGYLVGFIFFILIAGAFIDKFYSKIWLHVIVMLIGLIVCYAFGTAWLAYEASLTFKAALAAGVIPFIPFDVAKIVIAIVLGRLIRGRLMKAGILTRKEAVQKA